MIILNQIKVFDNKRLINKKYILSNNRFKRYYVNLKT